MRQSNEKLQYTNSIISEVVVWCILLLISLALHLIETLFSGLIVHANRKSADSVLRARNCSAFFKLVSLIETLSSKGNLY